MRDFKKCIINKIMDQNDNEIRCELDKQGDDINYSWDKTDFTLIEKEEEVMKYKLLKRIGADSLVKAQGNVECEEFDRELGKFVKFVNSHNYTCLFQEHWDTIFYPYFKDKPNCLEWLEEKYFIEKVEEEEWYCIGDVLSRTGTSVTYCLMGIGAKGIVISLISGKERGRNRGSGTVENMYHITRKELSEIILGPLSDYKLFEKSPLRKN